MFAVDGACSVVCHMFSKLCPRWSVRVVRVRVRVCTSKRELWPKAQGRHPAQGPGA